MQTFHPNFVVFFAAIAGSLFHDAIVACRDYTLNEDRLPARYSSLTFYVLRATLAIVAGLNAVFLLKDINVPMLTNTVAILTGAAPAWTLRKLAGLVSNQLKANKEEPIFETDSSAINPSPSQHTSETPKLPKKSRSRRQVSDELQKTPKKPPQAAPRVQHSKPHPDKKNA